MLSLQIRTLAKNDIQEIVDYYDSISPKLADKFLQQLFSAFDLLLANPQLFQLKYRATRVLYLKTYPFGIHYRIDENEVIILAVIHTSRNPKTWKERS